MLTDETEQKVIEMYASDMSSNDICDILQIKGHDIGNTFRKHQIRRRNRHESNLIKSKRHREKYGDIQDLMRRGKFSGIAIAAKNRNIEFNISIEEIWNLFEKQDRKCALTGIDIVFKSEHTGILETTASLDRIDSNGSYVIGNVQWVHKYINIMKSDMSQQDFIDMCKTITNYQEVIY